MSQFKALKVSLTSSQDSSEAASATSAAATAAAAAAASSTTVPAVAPEATAERRPIESAANAHAHAARDVDTRSQQSGNHSKAHAQHHASEQHGPAGLAQANDLAPPGAATTKGPGPTHSVDTSAAEDVAALARTQRQDFLHRELEIQRAALAASLANRRGGIGRRDSLDTVCSVDQDTDFESEAEVSMSHRASSSRVNSLDTGGTAYLKMMFPDMSFTPRSKGKTGMSISEMVDREQISYDGDDSPSNRRRHHHTQSLPQSSGVPNNATGQPSMANANNGSKIAEYLYFTSTDSDSASDNDEASFDSADGASDGQLQAKDLVSGGDGKTASVSLSTPLKTPLPPVDVVHTTPDEQAGESKRGEQSRPTRKATAGSPEGGKMLSTTFSASTFSSIGSFSDGHGDPQDCDDFADAFVSCELSDSSSEHAAERALEKDSARTPHERAARDVVAAEQLAGAAALGSADFDPSDGSDGDHCGDHADMLDHVEDTISSALGTPTRRASGGSSPATPRGRRGSGTPVHRLLSRTSSKWGSASTTPTHRSRPPSSKHSSPRRSRPRSFRQIPSSNSIPAGNPSPRKHRRKHARTSRDVSEGSWILQCIDRSVVAIVEHHTWWNVLQLAVIVVETLDVTMSYGFPDFEAPLMSSRGFHAAHACGLGCDPTAPKPSDDSQPPLLTGDKWLDFDAEGFSGVVYIGLGYTMAVTAAVAWILRRPCTTSSSLGSPRQSHRNHGHPKSFDSASAGLHHNDGNCCRRIFGAMKRQCSWDSALGAFGRWVLIIAFVVVYVWSQFQLERAPLQILSSTLFWADTGHRLLVKFSKGVNDRLTRGRGADCDLTVYEPKLGYLVVDIVSMADIVVTMLPVSLPATRALHFAIVRHGTAFHLLRVLNWFRIFAEEETKLLFMDGVSTHALQFMQLIMRMFMCMHLTGCLMFAMAQYECDAWVRSDRTDPGVLRTCIENGDIGFLDDPSIFEQSITSRYVHGCAWALAQMTGMGLEIPNPRTAWEKIFTMTINVVGFTLYASVAGNLMATIAVVDEDILTFREKMKTVNRFMEHHNLPLQLRERLLKYYKSQRQYRELSIGANSALEDLPVYLRREMQLYVNHEVISRSALFNRCSGAFASAIAGMLQLQLCLSGDFLIREGDLGHEMYFVRIGSLEVVKKGVDHRLALLGPGSVIGEIAVLHEQARTASVRAMTLSHLFMLTKENFDKVSTHFPDDVSVIGEVADQRFSKSVKAIRKTASAVKALQRTRRRETMSSVAALLRKGDSDPAPRSPLRTAGVVMKAAARFAGRRGLRFRGNPNAGENQ